MRSTGWKVVLLALWLSPALGQVTANGEPTPAVDPVPADGRIVDIAPVLVSGVQTGPGVWTVRHGDHLLWILGTVSPLPQRMEWYSPQVESVIAQSQELIEPPSVTIGISTGGMLKALFAVPTLLKARRNPDGKTLRDVLPPATYAQWTALKASYLGDDRDIEQWRPVFAAAQLAHAALAKAGLESDQRIRSRIEAVAKAHRLKRTDTSVGATITDPRGTAKAFAATRVDELACFQGMLARLQADVADAADDANAWAVGDRQALAHLRRRADDPCLSLLTQSAAGTALGLQDAAARANAKWLDAAEQALAANAGSFATLPVAELTAADGLLAELRARGYEVVEPE